MVRSYGSDPYAKGGGGDKKSRNAQLSDPGLSLNPVASVTPAPGQRSDQAKAQRAALTQKPHGGATGLLGEWVGPSLAHLLTTGHPGSAAGLGLDIATLLPGLRGARAGLEFGRAAHAAEAGAKAAEGAKAAKASFKAGKGLVGPALRKAYTPRTITHNELTAQLPKARSRVTNVGERLADRASKALQDSPHVRNTPLARLVTTGERVAKAAGRSQRIERARADAAVAADLKAIRSVSEGSPEDVANFWYAQLPKTHRNADGLALVRAMQADELHALTSGERSAQLNAAIQALQAKIRAAGTDTGELFPLLEEVQKAKLALTDIPARAEDAAASIGQLDELIKTPPAENVTATGAVHALNAVREPILADANRLDASQAENRRGLVSDWLGLEPTGEEGFIGHRLAKPDASGVAGYTPSAGTGRVQSPRGVGSLNHLVLASNGRLRPSLHVALEDHAAGQAFRMSNQARDDLGAIGTPFTGHVPEGHLLVNPKARTVPPHWKAEDLAQFSGDYTDTEQIRAKAKEIVDQFLGEDQAGWEKIKQDALEQGVSWDELRVVPKRLAGRYYSQFRSLKGKGGGTLKAYDGLIDAVATSIVFARVGYIPKNLVQNLIMAVPHQGPMLLVNAVRSAQAMADPELRHFMQAEVGHTGALGSLGDQAMSQKVLGKVAGAAGKVADDPIRFSAFMHEAAAARVISRVNPLLTEKDRQALLRLFRNRSQRPLLNDIRSRSVEAMADFSRMTPDQAKMSRRFLIIPGWLMAGTRYPFHFALTHPIRSALLAYIAMGEPGAPSELHFNKPLDEYVHGKGYKQGIDTPWGRVRTNSLSPVSTPLDLGQATVGTVRGKTGPFDFTTPTVWDEVQPAFGAAVNILQGGGVKKSLQRLAPGEQFLESEIHPRPSRNYPEDRSRLGRLKRELGVVPIQVDDNPARSSVGGYTRDPYSSGGSNSYSSDPYK